MSGNRNHDITFDNHFKTAMNSNDNLLSTKVRPGSIVVGIAENKKEKENRSWQLPIAFILSRPSYAR